MIVNQFLGLVELEYIEIDPLKPKVSVVNCKYVAWSTQRTEPLVQ